MKKHVPSGHGAIPIAPSMEPALLLSSSQTGPRRRRHIPTILGCIALSCVVFGVAELLILLIRLVSNAVFYQAHAPEYLSPAHHTLGAWVVLAPALGGLIVGLMARYGSPAIRGHGIPEAMEQILTNKSRIPARITLLKPLSAAISIGTGGPFGAEGPIIATGGALGSLLGQFTATTATERRILLAAGAVAGMTAIFGTPFAALLLAIELLLFEFDARSYLPIACACVTAVLLRTWVHGPEPFFPMTAVLPAGGMALAGYAVIGGLIGLCSVGLTRLVYWVEDGFEKLPIHWMWWPALGGAVVGIVGLWFPQTLGVGYDNIGAILNTSLPLQALLVLAVTKSVSWLIALGSGTSGGTLAPLLMIGGALGGALGFTAQLFVPNVGVVPSLAAMVGMAAMFGGASHAMLASIVFLVEATGKLDALPPLLAGTALATLVARYLMKQSIMSEKIARRGTIVPTSYRSDPLAQVTAGAVATKPVRSLKGDQTIRSIREQLAAESPADGHQGYPVVDPENKVIGVLTRRDILASGLDPDHAAAVHIKQMPWVIREHQSLREAADMMIRHEIGRVPVVTTTGHRLMGILTRSDVLRAERGRLSENEHIESAWRPAWFRREG